MTEAQKATFFELCRSKCAGLVPATEKLLASARYGKAKQLCLTELIAVFNELKQHLQQLSLAGIHKEDPSVVRTRTMMDYCRSECVRTLKASMLSILQTYIVLFFVERLLIIVCCRSVKTTPKTCFDSSTCCLAR